MRILAGHLRGKHIRGPRNAAIRPTPQMVREAIFNILGDAFCGESVLDLFAGTGALGIEALSRGARHCTFVDISRQSIELIRESLSHTGLSSSSKVLKWDLRKGIPKSILESSYSLVFMDPPYDTDLAERILSDQNFLMVLGEMAKIIVETRKGYVLPEEVHDLKACICRTYGDTQITIYEREGG